LIPLLIVAALILLAALFLWLSNYNPADGSHERIDYYQDAKPKILERGQTIKVMTYNIQFMAGKKYVFFFDLPDWSGPDVRPRLEDIYASAQGMADMIRDEDPDILLLQEVDDSSKRTGYKDQLDLLLGHIQGKYACSTATFYWKVKFVPHPKIWGPVGIKQVILSKYTIAESRRFNLPMLPVNSFIQRLSARRAILQAVLPVQGGRDLAVMNTHLEAFTVGTNIMEQQVRYMDQMLSRLSADGKSWVIGGDLNLLPAGQYDRLPVNEQGYYNPDTEISTLYDKYRIVPSMQDLAAGQEKWFTYWGNDPALKKPDRTLDYLVYSDGLELVESRVRTHDTDTLSDHFPVIAIYKVT
jgi:endonuclease/exonuclease/phosphatase family metal-dependent hydrolase